MKTSLFWVSAWMALLTTGCSTQQAIAPRSPAGPDSPGHILEFNTGDGDGAAVIPVSGPQVTVPEKIDLPSALALTLRHNSSLAAFSQEVRARDAAALQAGLLPNPEVGVEVENFGGENDLQGFDGAETTIAFSQLLELGGKRENRRLVADLDRTLAGHDYRSKKLDVLAAAAKAFVEVLAAQQQVSLNAELLKLAEQTTAAVSEKVEAGKVSPVEKSRARITLAVARTEAGKVERKLEAAKRRLAGFWGAGEAIFSRATGQLQDVAPLPSEESLKAFLGGNPDLARWEAEIAKNEATLALARAKAIPDLTVSAGFRNFQDTDNNAFLVGFSMPIAFFDRNQGGIAEARALVGKAQARQQATRTDILTDLSVTWQNLSAAYAEAVALRDEILPEAQVTFESAELGYREGKLDFLQMLEAQRTLFAVRRQYLQSLRAYHLAAIDMERIAGVSPADIDKAAITESENKETRE